MAKYNPDVFPRSVGDHEGMTLLDWFAGQALAGLLSDHTRSMDPEELAEYAFEIADAMLQAKLGL